MKYVLLMTNGNALEGHSHAMSLDADSKEQALEKGYMKLRKVLDEEAHWWFNPYLNKKVSRNGLSYHVIEDTHGDIRKSCANALRDDATIVPYED